MATRLEVEAIATRLEAIATRLEAIAIRLDISDISNAKCSVATLRGSIVKYSRLLKRRLCMIR